MHNARTSGILKMHWYSIWWNAVRSSPSYIMNSHPWFIGISNRKTLSGKKLLTHLFSSTLMPAGNLHLPKQEILFLPEHMAMRLRNNSVSGKAMSAPMYMDWAKHFCLFYLVMNPFQNQTQIFPAFPQILLQSCKKQLLSSQKSVIRLFYNCKKHSRNCKHNVIKKAIDHVPVLAVRWHSFLPESS